MNAMRWVEHSDQVLARSYAIQKLDLELESSVRGFLLGGDERFLETFDRTRVGLASEVDSLRNLVADNPDQVRRIDQIRALQQQWNVLADERIAQRRANATGNATSTQAGRGKQLKDGVREQFDEIVNAEQRLRIQRTATANSNTGILVSAYVLLMLAVGATLAWRGRGDLMNLSGTFEAARLEQQRQSDILKEHAWLQENRTRLSERLA
ncbi:MAG: two-component system sensor histidine kinase/response regulator, partial [Comamonadaceae bacterium]